MTFFANSGAAWPDFDNETREAGSDALRAASRLFNIFANLESGESLTITRNDVETCARDLEGVAKTYESIARRLGPAAISGVMITDEEVAEWFGPFPFVESWPRDWITGGSILIGAVFEELSHRARNLVSAIRAVEPNVKGRDLAPSVFRILAQWEALERLARFVAVVNRNKPLPGSARIEPWFRT